MNHQPYTEGQQAWNRYADSNWKEKDENPYEEGSDDWKDWNRGWNTNMRGIEREG